MPIELGTDSLRPTHNFQLCQEGISGLNQYSAGLNMSCARTQQVTPGRLEAATPRSRVMHSTTESLRCLHYLLVNMHTKLPNINLLNASKTQLLQYNPTLD